MSDNLTESGFETTLGDSPEPETVTLLVRRLRAIQMAAAEAMDHAIRYDIADEKQRKNRIEVCSSAIANAAIACAEAAFELAREVGKR